MHTSDVVECLRNPHPARQHGDIRNEADIAHQLFTLGPRIASEYLQFPLILRETENRVKRGGLASAVEPDQSEDTSLIDAQIDAIQRDRLAIGLAESVCFQDSHSFGSFCTSVGFSFLGFAGR